MFRMLPLSTHLFSHFNTFNFKCCTIDQSKSSTYPVQMAFAVFQISGSLICSELMNHMRVFESFEQCWASGSGTGSACFWATRIRIHRSEVRIRIRLRILPFSHKCVERTEQCLQNQILTKIFSKKLNFLD
jgi:hypothetical protein